MTAPHLVYLGLGSNIEREANIKKCLKALADRYGELCISSVFESESVGFRGDPFYNLVVSMRTAQAISELSSAIALLYGNECRVTSAHRQFRLAARARMRFQ